MTIQDNNSAAEAAQPASLHGQIIGAVARGWCAPANEKKVIDHDLVMAITSEVMAVVSRPAATSGEAPDLQQLKALALAWTHKWWYGGFQVTDGIATEEAVRFIATVSPAVVLDLIARIERLQEDLALEREHLGQAAANIATLKVSIESAAAPAPSEHLSDAEYQAVLTPVLSEQGMSRYRNGDMIALGQSTLNAIIDRARAAVSAATKPTADEIEEIATYEVTPTGPVLSISYAATKPAAVTAVPEGWIVRKADISEYRRFVVEDGKGSMRAIREEDEPTLFRYFALIAAAPLSADAAQEQADKRDAERYRWLRKEHWSNGLFCVVRNPKKSVKLGMDCPSLELLDNAIDACIKFGTPAAGAEGAA